jgi:hypothetical protein
MRNPVLNLVHSLKDTWDLGARGLKREDFQTVLRATGETETTQQNIQDWLQLTEGTLPFYSYLLKVLQRFVHLALSVLPILLNFPFICFIKFLFVFHGYPVLR